ncbi:poly(A) polymerase [Cladophialophora carrionii]|uniref:polynucleotide adenylyltransferase n=1 Tax=Cladophialophora carrionii TaxID=86049 RepID=A0A1C1CIG3_9EURO|nr:poly(A) polymerase [Cladophialophora carrionii]
MESRRQPGPQPPTFDYARHGTPREYQERARGNRRGGHYFGPHQHRAQQNPQQWSQPASPAQFNPNVRAPPRHGQLYNPNAGMHYGTVQQQRAMRHLIMKQSDYLTGIGRQVYGEFRFTQEERDVKENFRLALEQVARNAIGAKYPDLQLDQVKLKCYGSLANGFALKDCDMDLLLSLPDYEGTEVKEPEPTVPLDGDQTTASNHGEEQNGFKADVQRILEKAFLDHEYGARLLAHTRVPILRICQSPTPELLENLRKERAEWEKAIDHTGVTQEDVPETEVTPAELDAVEQAVTAISLDTKTAPAKRGNRGNRHNRGNAGLEFTDDCGIQCDINFSNFVALHNSTLLRVYHSFDPRVKEIGIFVKIWAKLRDINTPYRGTLSSYGWILMVLHYLMNIASPPVIPNLQHLAKIEDSWNPGRQIELFEGFDVRFVQDHQGLQDIQREMAANKNRESAGQLLRGFFQYYGTQQGFHWTRDVISIRTKGGIVTKQAKGWTEARWQQSQNKSVRNRYLLAIEDPFEVDHNIARTVGHHGVVAIRDEFRRACRIIEMIGTDEELPAENFLSPVTDRVDTLRKDLDYLKQRQMQMRQEVEAKETAMLERRTTENAELPATDGTWGKSKQGKAHNDSPSKSGGAFPESKLTSTPPVQEQKQLKTFRTWRRRKVSADTDDDEDDPTSQTSETNPGSADNLRSQAQDEPKMRNQGLTSRAEVLLANGLDRDGNPIPWDIETQDGRWLHWRDRKVKNGTIGPFFKESYRELNEQCPYDSRRPSPDFSRRSWNKDRQTAYERPPWPANNANKDNSMRPDSSHPHSGESKIAVSCANGACSQAKVPHLSEIEAAPAAVARRGSSNDERSNTMAAREQGKLPQPQLDARTVGAMIPWDHSTRGGRWLLSRDRRIREGTFKSRDQRGFYRKLDAEFPYKPEMTWAELDVLNELLRRYYKQSLRATRLPPGLSQPPAEPWSERAPFSQMVQNVEVTENHQSLSQAATAVKDCRSAEYGSSLACAVSIPTGPSSQAVPMSESHASQDTVSDRDPTTPPDNERVPDMDFLRMQRLAFFTKHMTPCSSAVDTNDLFFSRAQATVSVAPTHEIFQTPSAPQLPIEIPRPHEMTPPEPVSRKADAGADEDVDQPSHLSKTDFSELSVAFSDSPIIEDPVLRVPTTLYPDVADELRPRDENPDIMPIPRKIGFQFDPRQLQDLRVISKGGNGCARDGAQFILEEQEYEWGGGGMMGHKTSTGPQIATTTGGHAPYEAGKGDEEGLLDELPRLWDENSATNC